MTKSHKTTLALSAIAAIVVMVVIALALVQSASAIPAEKTETSCSDDKLMNCLTVLANPEMQQVTKREDDCTARNRG